ncbi:MAG: patatin-like protein [Alphaproteobacteria bacterium]|nr:MAG: patatin-like protein [Alphaproteobacteria bacterium]
MQEKELRLAIVCSGGLSLAVYMHGLTRELLKLTRASRFYHAVPDIDEKQARPFSQIKPPPGQVMDTEEVYYELLQMVGGHVDLRVIIDVIAGASAGGINGIFLARALAHDLPYEELRTMWLDRSDVRALVAKKDKPSWSDKLMRPIVRWIAGSKLGELKDDAETIGKLVSMLQIARLHAPFDGERLVASLIETMEKMGEAGPNHPSLLPHGHQLDLFVTLTDFYGYSRKMPIYDPPIIEEQEHRHVLEFNYNRWPTGGEMSDFDTDGIPALAFAARATSSFPGLFPAAQMSEVDNVLKRQNRIWTNKQQFLSSKFKDYERGGADPELSAFVDGSVLNNKPLDSAIQAIQKKPAYRNVDRRLLYINPNPVDTPPAHAAQTPGMLEALKSSLSDLPRHEPIYDDLMWIRENNYEVTQTEAIVEAARPDIEHLVDKLIGRRATKFHISTDQISRWRKDANEGVADSAGFAYKGYLHLKLNSVIIKITRILADICDVNIASPDASFIRQAVNEWAHMREAYPEDFSKLETGGFKSAEPAWLRMLRGFDLDFRQRRIHFVIKHLNHLYTRLDEPEFADLSAYRLDYLKGRFYKVLGDLREREKSAIISHDARNHILALFQPILGEKTMVPGDGADFGRNHGVDLDTIIEALSRDLKLETMNFRTDDVFSSMEYSGAGGIVRRALLTQYLGFPYWDTLTFSVGSWRQQGAMDKIKVSRLSPQDCTAIRDTGPEVLQGVKLGNFGAFFRREDRENDYLWGRLHAADRLIDIVYDAAKTSAADLDIDVDAMKKKAFNIILDAEAKHLTRSKDLIETLRKEINALGEAHA